MIDHDRALELAAAALDFALSDDDREALQTHLDGCAGCRAVVARLREDAQAIADLAAQDAPADLRARILAAVAAPAAVPPEALAALPAGPRVAPMIPPRLRRPAALLAAAAVVVALDRRDPLLALQPERWPGRCRGEPFALGAVSIGPGITDAIRCAGHAGRQFDLDARR